MASDKRPVIDADLCTACGICAEECPTNALEVDDIAVLVRPDDCDGCGICADVCPSEAIEMK